MKVIILKLTSYILLLVLPPMALNEFRLLQTSEGGCTHSETKVAETTQCYHTTSREEHVPKSHWIVNIMLQTFYVTHA